MLHFGRVLRDAGLEVHAGRMLDVIAGLHDVGVRRRSDVRHVLRTLLVHREQDLRTFDEAFEAFWQRTGKQTDRPELRALGERPRVLATRQHSSPLAVEFDGIFDSSDSIADDSTRRAVGAYSPQEALRTKDFAKFTAEELEQAKVLAGTLRWELAARRTRRWVRGRGGAVDFRSLVRQNTKYGGELVELSRRRRKEKPRPLVVICDISGSMERYTRMLLHFIQAMARRREGVEAFLFATRLTRVTRYMNDEAGAGAGMDEAMRRMAGAVSDWAGGTRIGAVLRSFNVHWARLVLRRGAVVLLISDGWDRGDPAMLSGEIARLQRSCHRLIWLNPLLGSANYEPLTRGMQAALRFVDDFLPAHNVASLNRLAQYLNALAPSRSARGRPELLDRFSRNGAASRPSGHRAVRSRGPSGPP